MEVTGGMTQQLGRPHGGQSAHGGGFDADDLVVSRWTMAEVEGAAPDPKSMVAARKLARPGPWSDVGCTDALVWGKCQGSGSTPYQVSVDLTGPAFKCSCPSRKFPCKHGLALLMLWVDGEGTVADLDAPADFAASWQQDRTARIEARSTRAAADADRSEPVDPEAQARRRARRIELMSNGLTDLSTWMGDLVTQGLAAARGRPYSWWDEVAARLVDAQLPGLAERVREMGGLVHRRADRPDRLLAEVARWHLAARAWERRDALTPDQLGDLRAYLGWAFAADEIRDGDTIEDRWLVAGVHRTDDGRLQTQRSWLVGEATGRTHLVLDFAAVGGALRVAQVVGTVVEASVAAYPGAAPERVLLPDSIEPVGRAESLPRPGTVADALAEVAERLAANPFADRHPVTLAEVHVIPPSGGADDDGLVVDADGDALPIAPGTDVWRVLARTGGQPVDLFAEFDDGCVRPLTLGLAEGLVAV